MAERQKTLITPVGKFAFVNVFKPRLMQGETDPDKARYECTLIITPDFQKTDAYKELQKAVIACAKDAFGEKVDLKRVRMPFKKGSDMPYDGIEDVDMCLSARSKQKPGLVDRHGNDILAEEDIYAGQWGRWEVRPYAYDVTGKGISLNLNHVQVLKDGTRIDGRKSAAEVFGAAEEVNTDELPDVEPVTGNDNADVDDLEDDLLAS